MLWVLFAPILRSTDAAYSHRFVSVENRTCRANDERNKEYSVHLVGPELNIYNCTTLNTPFSIFNNPVPLINRQRSVTNAVLVSIGPTNGFPKTL
jgi:hypothetical protein